MQKTITVTVNESVETHRVQSNQTLLDFLTEYVAQNPPEIVVARI